MQKNMKIDLFHPLMEPWQVLPLPGMVDMGVMTMNRNCTLLLTSELKPLQQAAAQSHSQNTLIFRYLVKLLRMLRIKERVYLLSRAFLFKE